MPPYFQEPAEPECSAGSFCLGQGAAMSASTLNGVMLSGSLPDTTVRANDGKGDPPAISALHATWEHASCGPAFVRHFGRSFAPSHSFFLPRNL